MFPNDNGEMEIDAYDDDILREQRENRGRGPHYSNTPVHTVRKRPKTNTSNFRNLDPSENSTCPLCKKGKLILRKNNANNHEFLGCSLFPYCKYSYSIDPQVSVVWSSFSEKGHTTLIGRSPITRRTVCKVEYCTQYCEYKILGRKSTWPYSIKNDKDVSDVKNYCIRILREYASLITEIIEKDV